MNIKDVLRILVNNFTQGIIYPFTQYKVSFLDPASRKDNLADPYSVFGRDMLQVFSSNLVFVDAKDSCGLGVGAEMD